MKDRVRLVDIANAVGVSVNTVSLALKDSPRISEETRALVKSKAAQFGYVPNALARSLATRESPYIGVLLRNLSSPVLIYIAREIERTLAAHGYYMILMSAKGDARQEIDALRMQQVGGLLLYPDLSQMDWPYLERLRGAGLPVVLMSSNGQDDAQDIVYVDRTVGAYRATSHLARLGHRRIGYLAGDACKTAGHLQALEAFGCRQDASLRVRADSFSYEGGYRAAGDLFARKSGATAMFVSTDTHAIGVLRYCQDRGIRVPEDFAIVGYDNTSEAAYASVRLTIVAYDFKRQVDLACNLLFARMRGQRDAGPEVFRLKPALIIRESCGAQLGNFDLAGLTRLANDENE